MTSSSSSSSSSSNNNDADPFAPRPGRTLTWNNVSLKVKNPVPTNQDAAPQKTILHSLDGSIEPTQLTAIMGSSGAGKTSLLNVLAGRTVSSTTTTVTRTMTLDGTPMDPSSRSVKRKIALVEQRDTLLSTATPREALTFSAKLRLKADLPDSDIDRLVHRMLQELHLEHVADNLTGNEVQRGLSGGELRRLSLGIELVVRPSLLFCDEITSGLDSHNATVVMQVLKKVAECGAAVLLTIHQPNSKVFNLIDNLYLMKDGQCMYYGAVRDVPRYFGVRNYAIPESYSPADWIVEVAQTHRVEELKEAGFFGPIQKSQYFLAMETDTVMSGQTGTNDETSAEELGTRRSPPQRRLSIFDQNEAPVSLWMQVKLQVARDFRKMRRDRRAMVLRFLIVVGCSSVIALTFQGAGTDSLENMKFLSHVGAMFFLIMTNMIALQLVMLDQIEGRPIYQKEYSTDHFSLVSYQISKFISEQFMGFMQVFTLLLITYFAVDLQGSFWYWLAVLYCFQLIMTGLGVALAQYTKDARNAKELIPVLLLPNILFSGFFVDISALPQYLRWLQWCVPLTYAFRLLLNEEFNQCIEQGVVQEEASQCFQALLNSLSNADGDADALYSINSTVRIPQTGQYSGNDDIGEYFTLFSDDMTSSSALFVERCPLKNSMKLQFNGISDNGVCDLTLSDVSQARLNGGLIKEGFEDTFVQYLYGQRFMFTYSEDMQMSQILYHDLYFPVKFTTGLLPTIFDRDKVVADICSTLRDECPQSYELDGYDSFDQCLDRISSIPGTTFNSQGLEVADGNSTTCRILHAGLAKNNEDHCPHISFKRELDKDGLFKCSDSYDTDFSDFFSAADRKIFADSAEENGLGKEQQIKWGIPRDERRECRANVLDREDEILMALPDEYVESKICLSYLEMQNATGENNFIYWCALGAFFATTRLVGLYLSRRLVVTKGRSKLE